jgi:hypothetical protein
MAVTLGIGHHCFKDKKMYVFHQFGAYVLKFANSFKLFFSFIGYLFYNLIDGLRGRRSISKDTVVKTIFNCGTSLVIPLMIISALIGISLSINIFNFLRKFHLEGRVWDFAQDVVTQNIVPLLIAVFLCVRTSLTLIPAGGDRSQRPSEYRTIEDILLIILGVNISGVLLYIYCITAFHLSIYLNLLFILQVHVQHYFIHLGNDLTVTYLLFSLFKTGLYCTIVSIVIGYYYHVNTFKDLPIDNAISKVITRSLIWLAISAACFNFITF